MLQQLFNWIQVFQSNTVIVLCPIKTSWFSSSETYKYIANWHIFLKVWLKKLIRKEHKSEVQWPTVSVSDYEYMKVGSKL